MTVRWKFDDVWHKGPTPYSWTVDINPNEGGSPTVTKTLTVSQNQGPRRGIILQEGHQSVPVLSFSGVMLTQQHYETFELWYSKRILLDLTDDLGRKFRGILNSFAPTRTRRAFNPWFHTYTAEFQATAYTNASGQVIYGRAW